MNTITATLAAFREQYPTLNPFGIYCLFTGRLMAAHPVREIHQLIESMEGDPDERADDLAMRLLASCRPSIRWNHLRVADIETMRATHPVETLCYLVNGATAPRIDVDFFDEMMARIGLYHTLDTAPAEAIECLYFEFYMAEEDSLNEQQLAARRMRSWLESSTPEGVAASRAKRIATIEAEAEAIRQGKIKRWTRPVGERTIRQREAAAKMSMASAFFDSIFNSDTLPVQPSPNPINPPAATRPSGIGFRIKLPVKES